VNDFIRLVQDNKPLFDAMHALSSVFTLIGWTASLLFIFVAWRRGRIQSFRAFGVDVQLAQEAVVAASRATRQWATRADTPRKPGQRSQSVPVDIGQLRHIIDRAFVPEVAARLAGRSILWADDNPKNNTYEAEALGKMGLVVEQVLSTQAALEALKRQSFDLVISDMGRGTEVRAGYDLLEAIRASGGDIPYLLYSAHGSDPAHVAEARKRGAQGSTEHPAELLSYVIALLGEDAR
jgi:CheY-like chemotaxis protein